VCVGELDHPLQAQHADNGDTGSRC
jgi:hypothetical protein